MSVRPRYIPFGIISNTFIAALLSWIVFFIFRKRVLHEGLINSTEYTKLFVSAFSIALMWLLLYYLFGFYHNVYKKSRIKEFA